MYSAARQSIQSIDESGRFPRNKHGEIKQQHVTGILTHPIYTGHICSETYGINWLPAQHEALISLEVYDKAILTEKLTKQAEPKGSFEEKLEPSLTFLASPWKLWKSGHITLRRVVLKLAFTGPIRHCRNEGARTPQTSLPFNALGEFQQTRACCGAGERT